MREKKLNLLYCSSDNNSSSGAFLCMVSLCKYLQEKFNVNVLIVLPCRGTGTQLLIDNNIPYRLIKSRDWVIPEDSSVFNKSIRLKTIIRNIGAIISLSRLIKKENIDIIHMNTIWTWVAAIAGMITNTPVVWHIREVLDKAFGFKIAYKFGYDLINRSVKILAISNAVMSSYQKIDKEKTVVIYDGVDELKYYNDSHEIFTNENVLMICCGAIYKQKGQLDLIRACKELFDKGYKNWKLQIYGRGNSEELLSKIKEYELEDFISIGGYKSDIENYIGQADIAIVPSHFEGFGRITVESMMSGCCVVASDSGANPEIIEDKNTGVLFGVQDSSDLCNKLIWVLENKEECRLIAKRGQQTAIQKFKAFENAQKVYDVYEQVLGMPKGRRDA